jgi:hypothetical protein
MARARPLIAVLAATLVGAAPARAQESPASRIALDALAAVERSWSLARYDQAARVRATINLRGTNGLGVTGNLAVDRGNNRWRLDTAGDVGPLTLWADAANATLHVPALAQYAVRVAGALAPGTSVGVSPAREVALMRQRIEAGYGELAYRGEETVDGAATHVIVDTPKPGTTATYWIDARTSLPRRMAISTPGSRDLRLDFAYGRSARPTTVTVTFSGSGVRLVLTPRYDATGRVGRLSISGRMTDGTGIDADVNLLWGARFAANHFRFRAPAGAQRVPFDQLISGALFAAAGKLGPLASIFLGTR